MKSFSRFIVEKDNKELTITWGRCNPPTVGHGLLFDVVSSIATGRNYRIYVSQTQDSKKNPLDYETKIKYIRKMFPSHARNVILDRSVKTIFDLLTLLYNEGYSTINFIAGSDRVPEYKTLLYRYNNVKGKHGYYNFDSINVISAGKRDPDSEGVSGMSASKLRKAVSDNDFYTFIQGMPVGFDNEEKLFNDLRKAMGIKESFVPKKHVQFEPVSEKREEFVRGKLFSKGDSVIVIESNEKAKIHSLGPNYVIIEHSDGTHSKQWIHALEKEETEVDRLKDRAKREKDALERKHERDIEAAKERDERNKNRNESIKKILKNAKTI